MELPEDFLEGFAQFMQQAVTSGLNLGALAEAHEPLAAKFEGLDPVRTAAVFGGLPSGKGCDINASHSPSCQAVARINRESSSS